MLETLLIILYASLFCAFIFQSKLFAFEGLSRQTIISVFIIKLVAGIIYGIIYKLHYWGGDTYVFYYQADVIYSTFAKYPSYYLNNIIGVQVPPPSTEVFLYPPAQYYWKDFGVYSMLHLQAIIRIFSFGYYNIHVVFMAFFSLIAGLNFYRVFSYCAQVPRRILISAVFFVPSVLFWTSGLHKDGFVYLGLSLMLLGFFYFRYSSLIIKPLLYMFIGIVLIGLLRSYLIVLLIPASLALSVSLYRPAHTRQIFLGVYALSLLMLVAWSFFYTKMNILEYITLKHNAFLHEKGNSDFRVPLLKPSWSDILPFLPLAFMNTLLRPLLDECKYFLQYMASFEMLIFLALALASFFVMKRKPLHPVFYFILFYGISNYVMIGLLLSNAGTISRYRAIALGFFIIYIVVRTDWQKVGKWIPLKKPNLSKFIPKEEEKN